MTVPPWIQSEPVRAARSAWAGVSSIVVAPCDGLAGGPAGVVEQRNLRLGDDVRVVGRSDDRQRAPRPGDGSRAVARPQREGPVRERRAVGLIGAFDRRVDRLADPVGSVRPEVSEALLDIVARPIGRDVRVGRALSGDDRYEAVGALPVGDRGEGDGCRNQSSQERQQRGDPCRAQHGPHLTTSARPLSGCSELGGRARCPQLLILPVAGDHPVGVVASRLRAPQSQ